jgi:hypothetical protein
MPPRPEDQHAYNPEPLPNGYVSYSVTEKMIMPDGSPGVRSCSLYIPKQKDVPSVSIRIITHQGGALLMVTSLKIGLDVSGLTQITIAAQPVHPDIPATGVHYCNIVAIGKPA